MVVLMNFSLIFVNLLPLIEKAMRKLLNKMRDTAAKQDPATHESEIKKSHEELTVKLIILLDFLVKLV